MGWTWEVLVWENHGQGYESYTDYQGESLLAALGYWRRAKKRGVGCITIVWRG